MQVIGETYCSNSDTLPFGGGFTMCRLFAFPNMPHMRNIS